MMARPHQLLTSWLRRLHRRAPRRWRLGDRHQALKGFATPAETCREALLEFGRESDQEFTALARGLGDLNRQLGAVRSEAETLEQMLHDRDEAKAISSAEALCKSCVDLVHASIGIAVSEHQKLSDIERELLQVCGAQESFKRNSLMLRVLTMSFRIEAARMNSDEQGVFVNVAGAIETINRDIARTTAGAFASVEAVIEAARTERGDLKALERDLHGRAQKSIRSIELEIVAIRRALAPCAQHSADMAPLFASIGPQTLQVVGALQHQDIVRQQLEHVAAGFTDLQEHLGAEARGVALEPGYLHRALRLQEAHLRDARRQIETAGIAVVGGLEALRGTGGCVAEKLLAMNEAATAAFRESRIIAEFQEEIGQLSSVAMRSKEANEKITRLVHRIEEVVKLFSHEIVQHEFDVKLVALNAQIAAARLPSADALNKLAAETSEIAGENARVTTELVGHLQGSLDQLHGVKEEADAFLAIVATEKAAIEAGVISVSDKLERLMGAVRERSEAVRRDFASAHEASGGLLARVAFPAQIDAAFGAAEGFCAAMLAHCPAEQATGELSRAAAENLQAHRDRYTMAKETATHAAILALPVVPLAVPETVPPITPPAATLPAPASESPPPTAPDAVALPAEPPAPQPAAAADDGIELF